MIVVWDGDEVLAQTGAHFCRKFEEVHGRPPVPAFADWTDYHYGKPLNVEFNHPVVTQAMIDYRVIEDCEPFAGARKALEKVVDVWGQNILLSARGWHPTPDEATKAWFLKHEMDELLEHMVFVDPAHSKEWGLREIIRKHGRIELFVEDHPGHASMAINLKLAEKVALISRPWNISADLPDGVIRVESALEASQIVCK